MTTAYNVPSNVISKLNKELERRGVPQSFVFSVLQSDRGSECYPVFQNERGELISKRGIDSKELKKCKIMGVDIDLVNADDIYHETDHAEGVFKAVKKGRPNDYFADPVYKEIKAIFYELKRRMQECVKSATHKIIKYPKSL